MSGVTLQITNTSTKVLNLSRPEMNLLSNFLSVEVPNYHFAESFKRGTWDGKFRFLDRKTNTFPTGLLSKVVFWLENQLETTIELEDLRTSAEFIELGNFEDDYEISEHRKCRDYQVDTLNSIARNSIKGLKFPRGIVNIATNGGKSTVAMALFHKLYNSVSKEGKHLLFITHSQEIAIQFKETVENEFGLPVGLVGAGSMNIQTITVVLVKTFLTRLQKDVEEIVQLAENTVGFVADEAHHSTSVTYQDTLSSLKNAYLRIGLTGTVDKSNPVNEYKIYSNLGGIIKKVSNEFLIQKDFSAKPTCLFFMVADDDLNGRDYRDAYNDGIVNSQQRLDLIREICQKEVKSSNTVLVIVEHLAHGMLVQDELESIELNTGFLSGQLRTQERQDLLNYVKSNNLDVLIGTSVIDEGVDVSGINAIIYARGAKSIRKLLQGVGRGLRRKHDGSGLRYYDFIDDTHKILAKHSLDRYETLKNENFDTKFLSLEEYKSKTFEELVK